jgi:hypothetical protein
MNLVARMPHRFSVAALIWFVDLRRRLSPIRPVIFARVYLCNLLGQLLWYQA